MLVTYLNRARIALRRSWLTYACAAVMASTSVVASANCPRAYPEVTFLQVWQDGAQLTVEDWEQHFSALGKLGFSDVVLQWTRYDKFSLWQDDGGNEAPVLDRIVEGATAAGVCLWIGLTYDPEFWEKAGQQEMDAVADYLDWRLEEAELQIRNLANVWRDTSPGPCGWYITDEFDDDTWGDPPRLALARDYVSALTATLKANADRPVTLSFFSNGNTTPEELGQFVDNLIGQAQIDKLYMQDGVGAGKLEPDEARLRLSQVAQAIAFQHNSKPSR